MQTINTMLKRLSNKGAIRFDKVKTGKTYTHYYTASISQDEYKQAQSKFFIENIHKGSLFSFVSSLVEQNAISSQDIERAKRWLAEWQKDEKWMDDFTGHWQYIRHGISAYETGHFKNDIGQTESGNLVYSHCNYAHALSSCCLFFCGIFYHIP